MQRMTVKVAVDLIIPEIQKQLQHGTAFEYDPNYTILRYAVFQVLLN